MEGLKIKTLNILHGGGKRISGICERLVQYGADIIVITEFRENKNSGIIRDTLLSSGYKWQTNGFTRPRVNTVFIASKLPFKPIPLQDIPEESRGRVLMADFQNFSLLAVYFAQAYAKKHLFNYILDHGIKALGKRGMLVGDFNTGRHFIDESGKSFHCADLFMKIEESGLVDSWRKRNQDKKEFSWYSSKGNGFRIDHVFSTKEIDDRITGIYYDHTPRLQKETDHSAMIVELDKI